jgi:RNA polymerase sigma-70 factor (ECF subfamily)
MFNMIADYSKLETKAVGPDDLKLVHASENGDICAFERLVDRYHRKLLRIAHRVTNNREDSQDVLQETFVKVFQHLGRFRDSPGMVSAAQKTLNAAGVHEDDLRTEEFPGYWGLRCTGWN